MRFKITVFTTSLAVKLLQLLPVVLAIVKEGETSLPTTTTTCDESLSAPVVLPCPDHVTLKMSYVSRGSIDCGGQLSLEQASVSPSIKADPSIINPDGLYSLVLVDTTTTTNMTDTFFTLETENPILHYGAVNIVGSTLLGGLSLDRHDEMNVFSAYRGPSPPEPNSHGVTQDIENILFAYEYMLGAQSQIVDPFEVSELMEDGNLEFDYISFFEETVGVALTNLTANTHFVSGWCVREPPTTTLSGRPKPSGPLSDTEKPSEAPTTTVLASTSAMEAEPNGETDEEQPFDVSTGLLTSAATFKGTRTLSMIAISTIILTAFRVLIAI